MNVLHKDGKLMEVRLKVEMVNYYLTTYIVYQTFQVRCSLEYKNKIVLSIYKKETFSDFPPVTEE